MLIYLCEIQILRLILKTILKFYQKLEYVDLLILK